MEFCQIQLNYLDWTLQDAKTKYEMLTKRGIPVWVMEPVRGGKLSKLEEEKEALLKQIGWSDCFSLERLFRKEVQSDLTAANYLWLAKTLLMTKPDTVEGVTLPGSSLKGKIRTLLARSYAEDIEHMPEFQNDNPVVLRMFGSTTARSRLQFADAFVSNADRMQTVGLTEVKFENYIKRLTAEATPRQIERVNPGTVFAETIVYDACDAMQMQEDLALLAKGMKLLQMDYLGGHGSRGSGRVSLKNFRITSFGGEVDCEGLKKLFDEVADYELFSVSAPV